MLEAKHFFYLPDRCFTHMLSDPCIPVMIVKTMGVVRRRARALATAEKSPCQLQFPTSIQMGRFSPTHVAQQHERVFNGPRGIHLKCKTALTNQPDESLVRDTAGRGWSMRAARWEFVSRLTT